MARTTVARLAVLAALLEDPTSPAYGLEIVRRSGFSSGTIYPLLAQLEAHGWVESQWEDIDEAAERRPRRRYYLLTGVGARSGRAELAEAQRLLTPAWRPRLGRA